MFDFLFGPKKGDAFRAGNVTTDQNGVMIQKVDYTAEATDETMIDDKGVLRRRYIVYDWPGISSAWIADNGDTVYE